MGWLAAAVVSQVVIIGVLFACSYFFAREAIGSTPANTTALITVWVSDPSWHVAPEVEIGQDSWSVGLWPVPTSDFALSHPDAEAVVILWGDAELSNPRPDCLLGYVNDCARPLSSAVPGSYQRVQVPQEQASYYVENFQTANVPGFQGPTIPAQIFTIKVGNYHHGRDTSVFPVVGQPSPGMETTTSAGWSAFVPSAGTADISGTCSPAPAIVPQAIASVIGSGAQGWFDTSCPSPSVQLFTQAGQTFSSSTVAPTDTVNGIPTWTASSGLPDVGGFWLDVADPAIAATSQRDLFFAGVVAGIAGGLLAGWLAAGLTFIVKRSMAPDTPSRRAQRKAAQGWTAPGPASATAVSSTPTATTAAGPAPLATAAARAAGLVVRDAGTADRRKP
jgi:hypothetical protein